ncbi:MAG: DUF1648 domain-containing protein [Saprospiraceae bacterium]|nr:DUF1648 domain-containing protein [Saprospiraceae bacterium]
MDNRPRVELELSRMDKVLHTGSRIALILTWMTFFFIYIDLPEISPTHFNLHGEADGFGHKKIFFILPIICSLTFGLLWYLEDKPYLYNYPVKITPENAKKQYVMASRLMRYINVILPLMFTFILVAVYDSVHGNKLGLSKGLLPFVFVLVIIPSFYMVYKALKN